MKLTSLWQQADKTDNLKQVCGVVAVSITWDKYLRRNLLEIVRSLFRIPDILETFNHPSPELVQMIKNEVAAYELSPEMYWASEVCGLSTTFLGLFLHR